MPLTTAEDYPSPSGSAASPAPSKTILIFYSSIVDGKLWCPDCRAVDGLIKSTFDNEGTDWHGVIIYVGDRPTWRDSQNKFRKEWGVSSIPTLIRLDSEGKEISRLVESAITESSLKKFLEPST
ncbi:hypothetical protein M407DRAFT_103175 [Tulasnella calospora MUT 4182]|uniref:Thioredoxin domain-containing protein n=1 Tax=Tulasnella calospora MUT 4182 TaxID=1051891 RepID=A0A0C3KRV7_9AGAM|nr:hypothetical protein M407DRAFT_103175 [Tulasnella calospora MUT 4182]